MKHIVKVFRMKDRATRIYELPGDIDLDLIPEGTPVKVCYHGDHEAYGETVTASRYVTDDELALIKEMLGIKDDLARVLSILTANPLQWNDAGSTTVPADDDTGADEAQEEESEEEVDG